MDGSEVTVIVLGEKGVGKTSFISHCLESPPAVGGARHSRYDKIKICGKEISIRIVESPGRDQLVPAIMVIMLFDLTQLESFQRLEQLVEVAQRVSPVALRAVVGTKADLQEDRVVLTHEALDFCARHSGNGVPLPYYETSTDFPEAILLVFQEIMARPLINDYVIKATIDQEQKVFVNEVMEWAILNNSANILTHLRELGYPIPLTIIEKYPMVIRDYLLGEFPLQETPRFKHLELKELQEMLSWEDSLMEEDEESILSIQDTRPTIQVNRRYHLMWRDISLPIFLPVFLDENAMDAFHITHVDLSHNKLASLPSQLFHLPLLESLDLSHNCLSTLPPLDSWKPKSRLQFLQLSHNALTVEGCATHPTNKQALCPHLWYLDLSHNEFCSFPRFVLHFSLRHLNLSANRIAHLPAELGKMECLVTLLLREVSVCDPPVFVVERGTRAILHYLRLKLSSRSLWSSIRVLFVGTRSSGKTTLISKIAGTPFPAVDKGLDVVEWKYKGSELFSFRSRWLTFDLWDFSGDPDLEFMYASFGCEKSLHVVVCNPTTGVHDLVKQLSDLQSLCKERVLVIVVFTHMDQFKSREEKEKFKKTHLQWLCHHNKLGGNSSFSLMATTSVRSLQGEEMLTSYEAADSMMQEWPDTAEVKGLDIPLMPQILKIHFVSCSTGEGLPNLRKVLHKVGSGALLAQMAVSSPHTMLMTREVPTLYIQIEHALRQLRAGRHDNHDSHQQVFYTAEGLQKSLQTFLRTLKATPQDFTAAIEFIHQMGLIFSHVCAGGQVLVCLEARLIGCLLERTMHACRVGQEVNPATVFLANSHLCMMWGVEPILTVNTDTESPSISSAHLLHFLQRLKVLTPLLPGVMLLAPSLPHTLPRSCDPDSTSLTPRRSYVFSYLPSFFHIHLINRLVAAVVKATGVPTIASSPNQPSPPGTIPIVLPTGVELYLWRKNMFVNVVEEEVRVWVHVREVDVGLEPLPHCGRIDVHVAAPSLNQDAYWVRLITTEINWLLQECYPGLLDSLLPQKVEIFVPFNHKLVTSDPLPQGKTDEVFGFSGESAPPETTPPEPIPSSVHGVTRSQSLGNSPFVLVGSERNRYKGQALRHSSLNASTNADDGGLSTPPHSQGATLPATNRVGPHSSSSSSSGGHIADLFRKLGEGSGSPLGATPPASRMLSDHSWEVVSKYSTTSNRLSILQDLSDPDYDLVPLWECLQEAFKTPVVRVENTRLTLSKVIPDLLFADLPVEMLFRTTVSSPDHYLASLEDHFSGGVALPPPEATGMFVEPYYSFQHADVLVSKPAGALKALFLQSCLGRLRCDLLKLQELQSPHLVSPVGLQYCPPSLALEAAPFGSLSSWMRRLRYKINRVDVHQIALQVLRGLEYLHTQRCSYHSIDSERLLVWNVDPLVVKLAHNGITHTPADCELCDYLDSLPSDHSFRQSYRVDYMLLGLLVYEMATGKRPFADIYPLTTVVLAIIHDKIKLNVEADHFLQKHANSTEECIATGCQRLCLQSSLDQCLKADLIPHGELEARFSLCAGEHLWSPMRLLVNVEVMISAQDSELVYWASGSRGLVIGSMLPSTGDLTYNLLQEAPPPESGLFANRRTRPVPIAVGRASGLALVQETRQLWVGTENGQMGSVYVFNLPDMRRHHHIHLQDAVLSLCAVNSLGGGAARAESPQGMPYRVLVGLANGTVIMFLGRHEGKVLENPLQGPKLVIATHQRKPCLTMTLTSEGRLWCSCGSTMEVYDVCSLKLVNRLTTASHPTQS